METIYEWHGPVWSTTRVPWPSPGSAYGNDIRKARSSMVYNTYPLALPGIRLWKRYKKGTVQNGLQHVSPGPPRIRLWKRCKKGAVQWSRGGTCPPGLSLDLPMLLHTNCKLNTALLWGVSLYETNRVVCIKAMVTCYAFAH